MGAKSGVGIIEIIGGDKRTSIQGDVLRLVYFSTQFELAGVGPIDWKFR